MFQSIFIVLISIFLTACASSPPAPVVDRLPQAAKPSTNVTSKPNQSNKTTANDWRPDVYTVKKGDTLFSIGLEYGLDYKEIAAANHINEPYAIQIGQKLNLATAEAKPDAPDSNQPALTSATDDGVILTPIQTEPVVAGTSQPESPSTAAAAPPSVVAPLLSEPKSIREPYSLEAFNRAAPLIAAESKVTEPKVIATIPVENKQADAKPTDDEAIIWGWPTPGKVLAHFNEATNKGMDIGGNTGQAINAASGGKVIYSGSDLRGYGKLVIIKHNKTYLSVYAHNSKIIVKEGQVVAAGQKIAEMGDTDTNRVKLHFEIRRLGKSVDPAKYLNQQ